MGDPKALRPAENPFAIKVDPAAFAAMAENLSVAWTAPGVTMRVRQHLLPPAPATGRRLPISSSMSTPPGVTNHAIRRLVESAILPAEQVV